MAKHLYLLPEYNIWNCIKQRCGNQNNPDYKNYGGRGITICEEWENSFDIFYRDIGKRPNNLLTLDRIDNDGNYEPGNVRWTTRYVQRINSRSEPFKFKAINKSMGIVCHPANLTAFAKMFRLNKSSVSLCLHKRQEEHRGWVFELLNFL